MRSEPDRGAEPAYVMEWEWSTDPDEPAWSCSITPAVWSPNAEATMRQMLGIGDDDHGFTHSLDEGPPS